MDRPKGKDRIIAALDFATLKEAEEMAVKLSGYVGMFKVGLQLLTAVGAPAVVNACKQWGGEIFYDGKFCDIPNTVGGASAAAAELGVKMFNLHASCGSQSMAKAVENKGDSIVLAVTVLTSINEEECQSIFGEAPGDKAVHFAYKARREGIDGIICSSQELNLFAFESDLADMIKVIPGIRPAGTSLDDQQRTNTPGQAVKDGADYLVIGRAITSAENPAEAAIAIAQEIEQAEKEM